MKNLKISQVAKAANVSVETIKYYEKRGLLSKPERNRSGYRMFSESAVDDILLIKRAQEIGFTLKEIEHILALIKQDDYFPTDKMYEFSMEKINEINEEISRLEYFKSLLELAVSRPSQSFPRDKQDCPVLKKLKG
ncbi:MerR family transcriptional regulator [Gracilibacillus xinjiangensis]|uniref:MerR family transcriptional regulator n=1 Tax=Gracilibacillus xinjiangensis TaxID=1193282 RepID=A0ABV8WRA1_9BACI